MSNENKPSTNLFDSFNNNNSFNIELHVRLIKILDIGYITVLYFISAYLVSKLFNYVFGKYEPNVDTNKSTFVIGIELCGLIWLLGISTYIVRNIIELIPSPFEDIYGFHHKKVKELGSAAVYTLILFQGAFLFRGKLNTFLLRNF